MSKLKLKYLVPAILVLVTVFIVGIIIYKDKNNKYSNVSVSNVSDSSFTITWSSNAKNAGELVYQSGSSWPIIFGHIGKQIFYDDRDIINDNSGQNTLLNGTPIYRYTHKVTINKLQPNTKYTVRIPEIIADQNLDIGEIKTKALITTLKTPNPAYGKVIGANNGDSILILHRNDLAEADNVSNTLSENYTYSFDLNVFDQITKATQLTGLLINENTLPEKVNFKRINFKPLEDIIYTRQKSTLLGENILTSTLAQSDPCQAGNASSYTTNNGINVRKLPSLSGSIAGGIQTGVSISVGVCAVDSAWGQLTSGNYQLDYVFMSNLTPSNNTGNTPPAPANPSNSGTTSSCSAQVSSYSVITASGINVHSDQSTSASTVVGGLPQGTIESICALNSQWGQIIGGPYDGRYVYLSNLALTNNQPQNPVITPPPPSSSNPPSSSSCSTGTSITANSGSSLNLRDGKSTSSNVLKVIQPGDMLCFESMDCNDSWGKVNYQSIEGYVYLPYTNAASVVGNGCNVTQPNTTNTQPSITPPETTNPNTGVINPPISPPQDNIDIAIRARSTNESINSIWAHTSEILLGNTDTRIVDVFKENGAGLCSVYGTTVSCDFRRLKAYNDFHTRSILTHEAYHMLQKSCTSEVYNSNPYSELGADYQATQEANGTPQDYLFQANGSSWVRAVEMSTIINNILFKKLPDLPSYVTVQNLYSCEATSISYISTHPEIKTVLGNIILYRFIQESTENHALRANFNPGNTNLNIKAKIFNNLLQPVFASQSNTVSTSGTYSVFVDSNLVSTQQVILQDGQSVVNIRVFNDLNGNGIKDPGEDYISNDNIKLSQTDTVISYNLSAGWNLINVPFLNIADKDFTASKFLASFQESNFDVTKVATFQNNKFVIYNQRDIGYGNDFNMSLGKAIFIFNNTNPGVLHLHGQLPESNVPIILNNGWNLVGNSFSNKQYDSQQVIDAMNNRNFVATNISAFANGLYNSVIYDNKQYYGNNFNITNTQGYFVLIQSGGGGIFTF